MASGLLFVMSEASISALFMTLGAALGPDNYFLCVVFVEGAAMRTVEQYRERAEACRKLAKQVAQPEDKKVLEELAQAWEKLVELRRDDIEPEPDTP